MAEATPKMEYPKWLYHGTEGSKLVKTPEEEKQLQEEAGGGWEVHPDKARAEHIKKVNELQAKSEEEKKKIDAKYAEDKAKQENDLARQLKESSPEGKKAAEARARADADAAKVKADADARARVDTDLARQKSAT
jgi:hypothetical protein